MNTRETYILTLRPRAHRVPALNRIRRLMKFMDRHPDYQIDCIEVQHTATTATATAGTQQHEEGKA